jgi:hypothetical protein
VWNHTASFPPIPQRNVDTIVGITIFEMIALLPFFLFEPPQSFFAREFLMNNPGGGATQSSLQST